MPPPTPAAHTDLSAGPDSIDSKMADAEVTEEQLKKSNEPTFNEALGAKDEAKEHSDEAPGGLPQGREGRARQGQGRRRRSSRAPALTQMQGARGQALNQAVGHKQGAKTADEAKRAKVANDIQGIYDRTKADVTKTLDGLDGKVDAAFTQGEGAARKKFEDYVGQRMDAYKDDRYGGLFGGAKWLKDKLFGMPSEVNAFYAEGKTRYLADMDGVIGKIADIVGTGLNAARARIAQGKAEIAKYVAAAPAGPQEGRPGGGVQAREPVRAARVRRRLQAERDRRHARAQVRRVTRRARRPDRRDEGRQPRPRRQGDRRHRRRDQDDHPAQEHAAERPGQGRGRDRRHHRRPDRLPRQPDRRHQGGPVAASSATSARTSRRG